MKLRALILFLLFGIFAGAQITPRSVPSNNPPLATLTAHPDKSAFKLGEDIRVTLTLRAGPEGAYVARSSICAGQRNAHYFWCGRHMGNASGFDVSVYTLTGENAEPMGAGGVADSWSLPPPPAERFKRDFVFLKPGEKLKWRGRTASSPT